MGELQGRSLTVGRFLSLWGNGLVAALGWVMFSLGLGSFEDRSADYVTGLAELVLGLFVLVPALAGVGFGVARDRTVRGRLDAWAAPAPDPENDHRLWAGVRSAVWLGFSVALCVIGLGLALIGVGRPGSPGVGETAYLVGTGVIALVIGVLGAVRAVGHRRGAGRVLSPVPERGRGGATAETAKIVHYGDASYACCPDVSRSRPPVPEAVPTPPALSWVERMRHFMG